jgi:hypothetical protein
MKVRIGMTVPIALTTLRTGTLRLPYFHERTFDVPAHVKHSVWIESQAALKNTSSSPPSDSDLRIVKAEIADAALSGADGLIAVQRAPLESIWSRDEHQSAHIVKQTLRALRAAAPNRIAVVVDGSATMKPFAASIARALATLPTGSKVTLSIAADAPALRAARAATPEAAAKEIGSMDFVGGHDNTEALVAALDSLDGGGALLWIHGPEPVLQQTSEGLRQRLERSVAKLAWYDVQVTPGPNLIASGLDAFHPMNTLSLTELQSHFEAWSRGSARIEAHRERIAVEAGALPPDGEQTSTHLARLWAHDEIRRLIAAGPEQRTKAIALAMQYQLVSPVTGAVVLETQQQYDEAGLTPVPPGTVPTIPEPEEWALIAVALGMLLYMQRRRLTHLRAWA